MPQSCHIELAFPIVFYPKVGLVTSTSSPPATPEPKVSTVQSPPTNVWGILARLGPGLIIAGSIVGSGELIGTTKTGAEAGFWLLWLIIVGCVIKVFVQVELGRDAVVRGKTTMDALSEVPGPRIAGRGNWLLWYFFVMFFASLGQLGGIIGGVGQALAISAPLTEQGRAFNEYVNNEKQLEVAKAELELVRRRDASRSTEDSEAQQRLNETITRLQNKKTQLGERPKVDTYWTDDRLWAVIIALVTAVLLVVGRYAVIERVTTTMVAMFTMMTLGTVVMLQMTYAWSIDWEDILNGLSFRLPPAGERGSSTALSTALKTFGIIGVGATELISYPYWCIEKGYARYTGPRDASPGWAERARGWMNVMRWDAWCSMVVYTIATVAFYLLGAAVLGRAGLNPAKDELIRTLNVMYEPVFGVWAQLLFLVGAVAVLYSTYFVANAGHARVFSDALRVVGLAAKSDEATRKRVRVLSGFLPLFCLVLYLIWPKEPERLVLISGMMQALMLPMLAAAALFFRFRRCDERVRPGPVWDAFLWISSLGMLVAAICLLYTQLK
jgi:Mn2+/Fe2+ NRAMP family transporter